MGVGGCSRDDYVLLMTLTRGLAQEVTTLVTLRKPPDKQNLLQVVLG